MKAYLLWDVPAGNIVRVVNRPAQQLLGMNGRDEGPSVRCYI